jgi:glycerophosphoryl diester phosphodiesterase
MAAAYPRTVSPPPTPRSPRGIGIECDVRLARDGAVLVFHDADAARMCGVAGDIATIARDPLRLAGTDERVPTLAQLLARVAGRVPVLIEIKRDGALYVALCLGVRRALEGYRGQAAVMSFDPRVPRWFAIHAPRIVRGLVVRERRGVRDGIARRIACATARPEFVAYDVAALPSALPATLRARGLPLLAWTVRTPAERDTAARFADRPILERM